MDPSLRAIIGLFWATVVVLTSKLISNEKTSFKSFNCSAVGNSSGHFDKWLWAAVKSEARRVGFQSSHSGNVPYRSQIQVPPGSNLAQFVGPYQSQTVLGTGFICMFPSRVSLTRLEKPSGSFRASQTWFQQDHGGFNTSGSELDQFTGGGSR